jgi:hypothetical protein
MSRASIIFVRPPRSLFCQPENIRTEMVAGSPSGPDSG